MKIACLGTSANPPHLGHLIAARHVLANAPIEEVWIIPCFKHSFGKDLIAWKHRFKMAKLMEEPKIRVCDIERGRGVSYTIKTLNNLQKRYPGYEFFWITGSGLISNGEHKKWRDWEKLSRLVKFYVVPRPGYPFKKSGLPRYFNVLPKIKGYKNDISSTMIRQKIKNGLSIEGLVIPKVEQYINKNKLY